MNFHANSRHRLPLAALCDWELIGMPEGEEPVVCPDCTTPFPHPVSLERHSGHCPGMDGYTFKAIRLDSPKPGSRAGGLNKKAIPKGGGKTYGSNGRTGDFSHLYNR